MHRVYLSFLILFLSILSVHAQYTIEGSVLDANTSSAIEMSTVRLYRVSTTDTLFVEGCQTGAEGRFILRNIANGDYFVLVSNIGYKEQKTPVRINGSNISIKAIRLQEDVQALSEVRVTGHAAEMTVKENPEWKDLFE